MIMLIATARVVDNVAAGAKVKVKVNVEVDVDVFECVSSAQVSLIEENMRE